LSKPPAKERTVLSDIHSPQDIKNLTDKQVQALLPEIREAIIDAVAHCGGHLASNLGAVELTVALHRVFDTPRDKIVFDVGHQCYTHKILTGRYDRMHTLRQFGGLSGFPRITESEHDAYGTGHASTAISAALGLARARDLQGGDEHVVAVVGDGALTGGMCYEALNDAGSRKTRLIVILNDNQMSIAPNVGALSNYLTYMRTSRGWIHAKRAVERALKRLPLVGKPLHHMVQGFKNHLRNVFVHDKFFDALGFRYLGPVDGQDEKALETFLRRARMLEEPVLLHIVTTKGQGYTPAESEPARMHGVQPFDRHSGSPATSSAGRSFGKAAGEWLTRRAHVDQRIVAVAAAMADSTGLGAFRDEHPARLFDVGIAEEHAVTLAAGMARGGLRPFVAIYDTFLQRGFDQLIADVAVQNLPVVFLMDRAGLGGEDGPTHHGVFGLSYLRMIPGMTVLAPRCIEELQGMLAWALAHSGPVAIRYPRAETPEQPPYPGKPFVPGQWEVLAEGKDVALLASGSMVAEALSAAHLLADEGIQAAVISAGSVKPLDEALLRRLMKEHIPFVTLEEHVLIGGFGSAVAEYCTAHGLTGPRAMLALPDAFVTHGARDKLLHQQGLDAASIAGRVQQVTRKNP
jgi:1-deoxy-D-xylulose-5-phosphate synthase